MKVIVGCVVVRDRKVLMVKGARKSWCGKWCYPAGHLNDFEGFFDGAIRETFEETGCKVKLTGVLPIVRIDLEKESHVLIRFVGEIVNENISFDSSEIMDVRWMSLDEIKCLGKNEFRDYDIDLRTVYDVEANRVFPLDVFIDD